LLGGYNYSEFLTFKVLEKLLYPSPQVYFSFTFQQLNTLSLEIFHMLFGLPRMPFLSFLLTCPSKSDWNVLSANTPVTPPHPQHSVAYIPGGLTNSKSTIGSNSNMSFIQQAFISRALGATH
jgi:hypothetical protein